MLQTLHKKIWTRILVMALALALCMGLALPAFADDNVIIGTEQNPATAYITKNLRMPEGTDIPALTFGFEFAKKDWNGDDDQDSLDEMPALSNVNIAYSDPMPHTTENRVKTVLEEAAALGVPIPFANTGVYTYTITELQSLVAGAVDPLKETLTFSQAEYEISFYVKEKTDGSGLYVSAITVKAMKDDEGNDLPGEKVDAGGGKHGLVFTNTYTKTNGNPTDPTVDALSISKQVAGDFAEQGRYFAFDVTLTKPAVFSAEQIYKAYVMDATGVVTSADNVESTDTGSLKTDAAGTYIQFTTGSAKTIYLKHGQWLAFNDIHVGASYEANEQGVPSYTPSAQLTVGGTAIIPGLSAAEGQSLSTDDRMIGEVTNTAAFTNTMRDITPTGILLDNLPFIVILTLAAGAFALFLVVKIRQKNRYSSN